MHPAAQPCSNFNICLQSSRLQRSCSNSAAVHRHRSERRSRQQHQTAAAIGEPPTRTSAAFAETWAASARSLSRQKELSRANRLPTVTGQQLNPTSASNGIVTTQSSNINSHQHAINPQACLKQLPNTPSPSQLGQRSQQSTSGPSSVEDNRQTFASAVDKMYRQRLREVKAMLTPEAVQQLQQELSPEELQSLQVVLQDLQDLQASWEEDDEQFNPAEQQLIQQVTSAAQIMPDDFNTYILGMLPPGCGSDEVQQLLQMLDKQLLQDLKSVYYELKEFEQADLDISVAHDRYLELSARITEVAARIQSALAAQQQLQQQRRQQQQAQQQQQEQEQVKRKPAVAVAQQAVQSSSSAIESSKSSTSSSSSSSRTWGSSWAKNAAVRTMAQSSSSSRLVQVQPMQGSRTPPSHLSKQQQQQEDMQPGYPAAYKATAANQAAAPASQQQQQQPLSPEGRQRRRRVIRRETTTE